MIVTKMLTTLAPKFIDMHYHAMPDLYARRYHALEAGRQYQLLGGAVFLKSHLGCTSVQATLAQREGLPIFPSIVLNKFSGGINYANVIRSLSQYCPVYPSRLIVHFPTITGRSHTSRLKRTYYQDSFGAPHLAPETIFIEGAKNIRASVIDILKMARDYPIVLTSGHASKEEVYALLDACIKYHVDALILNQPANPMTNLLGEELMELSKLPFLWIEQTALTYLLQYQSKDDFAYVLKNIQRVIYSSDLGQPNQMDIRDWLIESNRWFSEFDLSPERKEEICLTNPLALFAL